ncbi:hypothetical protein [Acetobacter sp. AAB5]|uniref:hypothetical protein n=1 Tax=Acetobacter sp. AAB5 TaxID=3418370 RepID=UPI003CF9DC52
MPSVPKVTKSFIPKLTAKGIPSGSGVSDIKADHFAMTDGMSREQKASIAFHFQKIFSCDRRGNAGNQGIDRQQ